MKYSQNAINLGVKSITNTICVKYYYHHYSIHCSSTNDNSFRWIRRELPLPDKKMSTQKLKKFTANIVFNGKISFKTRTWYY